MTPAKSPVTPLERLLFSERIGMTGTGMIRIGTWNVEYAKNKRNHDRLKLLRHHEADIWILTETHRSLDLSSLDPPFSDFPSKPRPIVSNVDEHSTWVTLWSRFKKLADIEVPDPRRQVATLFETPVGQVAVAGVVLPWHSDEGDAVMNPAPANWSEHKRVLKDEIPVILKNLSAAGNGYHVIAGDFNTDLAPPYSYGPSGDSRSEWLRLLHEHHLDCHTMHEPYLHMQGQNFIDHICTDFGAPKALKTWPGKDGGSPRLSDHPGAIATFLV